MKFKIKVNTGDFAPSSRQMTAKGLLCRDAVLAIAPQVREYLPSELGLTEWDKPTVRVLTPDSVLFSDDVIKNLEGGDFVNDHPLGNQVTPDNWRKHSIGAAKNVRREDNKLVGDLLVKDKSAIDVIQKNKKVELSLGYEMVAALQPGKTEDGQDYDVVVTNMIGDHVALVKRGRGGSSVRIGDERKGNPMKIKLANGLEWSVEGENLESLQQAINDQNKALETAQSVSDATITIGEQTFKVNETEAIQAAFDALNEQKAAAEQAKTELEQTLVKPEDVERLATERAETIDKAKELKPDLEPSGKTIDDIINETVEAHAGDSAVTAILDGVSIGDAKPEQIKTAFKVLVATKPKANQVTNKVGDSATAKALQGLNKPTAVDAKAIAAQAKSEAWKGE